MVFSSVIFCWVFLPITVIGYYVVGNKSKNIFLLIASLIFYAWGSPAHLLLLGVSIVTNYIAGRLIDSCIKYKKIFLFAAIALNLGLLGYYKYFSFFVETVGSIFNLNVQSPNISLPIGISFFTFQALAYIIDIYKGEYAAEKNIVTVALYISFFPQLIAGPIVQYKDIRTQIHRREESVEKFAQGIRRFSYGLGKKVLISNWLGQAVDHIAQTDTSSVNFVMAWVVAVFYSLQIYYDFSGYSDMAIGLGKIFGFDFRENFNYPYLSGSIREFWQRWHISLGTWFRE